MERLVAWAAQTWMDLQNALLAIARFLLFPRSFPENPRSLVVFRVGNIGDTITALPAMVAIRERFAKSRILFLTSPGPAHLPGAQELLNGSDLFDRMITYTAEDIATHRGKVVLLKKLRSEGVEGYIELTMALASFHVCLRNMLFAKMSGAKGYLAGGVSTPFFGWRAHARRYPQPFQDAERTMAILSSIIPAHGPYQFPIPISKEGAARVETVLADLPRPIVALCPGGKREINRWPVERFGEVARRLSEESGASILVVGGPGDGPLWESVRRFSPTAVSAIGLDLQATADLLRRITLLLTNDTGPMHLAAAVGTPVVAIFSARDYPRKWYPYGNQHVVLRREVSCSCCFLEHCPTMHCNRDITVDEVVAVCRKRLQELSQAPAAAT